MSVQFLSAGMRSRSRSAKRDFLFDLDFIIEKGQRVAILGPPKSGKSTLLRLICGTARPDFGRIVRTSSVSWPIPCSEVISPGATIALNVRFVARIYGLNADKLIRQVGEVGEITEFLNTPLKSCPPLVVQKMHFALGLCSGFDICLIDERLPAKEFRTKSIDLINRCGAERGVVMATSATDIGFDCDFVLVLEDGTLTRFADIEQGLKYFQVLLRLAKPNKAAEEIEPEPVEQVPDMEFGF